MKIGVERMAKKLSENRLRWFGHVERREDEHVGRHVHRFKRE